MFGGVWHLRTGILSADSEFCRVLLPEYRQEETVASVKVIPRLPRALIDRAIAACGVRYDLPREIKHAALALETNAARTRAERTRRSSGEVVWADVNPFYVPATQSTPAFCAAIVVDITDRKQAGAALRASEERWRAMFETAPVGITRLDFEHRSYLAANVAFQRITGYSEDELRQLNALDVTHEDDRAATRTRIDDGAPWAFCNKSVTGAKTAWSYGPMSLRHPLTEARRDQIFPVLEQAEVGRLWRHLSLVRGLTQVGKAELSG